ncbi:etoposide-induced protein 2.4 homolog [Oscarella lobularis]|uniref:etoposide-induced protein 2.4 homolog n=1 Tax=Oscarella lobularis TaxID=121494 RepID=UPI003313D17C
MSEETSSIRRKLNVFAAFGAGLSDALIGLIRVVRICKTSTQIRGKMIQCLFFNGICLGLGIVFFDNVVVALLNYFLRISIDLLSGGVGGGTAGSWVVTVIQYLFSAFWVLPLFWLSKPINSLWFLEISDEVLRLLKADRINTSISLTSSSTSSSTSSMTSSRLAVQIADAFFSLILECLFLVQAVLVGLIPPASLGLILNVAHLSLLYALYSFEYAWMDRHVSVVERLAKIECDWPYYLGFGLPLTIATVLPNSIVVSASVFAVLFPAFLIIASDVEPATTAANVWRLRVFRLVTSLTNRLASLATRRSR